MSLKTEIQLLHSHVKKPFDAKYLIHLISTDLKKKIRNFGRNSDI